MFIWQKYIECYRYAKKVRGVYLFIFPQILKMHDLTKKSALHADDTRKNVALIRTWTSCRHITDEFVQKLGRKLEGGG